MIDSVLNDAAAMNLAVVRAWAFMDGDEHSGKVLQPRPGVYNSADFDSLDYAIYKAGTLGIRLVLPLVNNWPDYGGMSQYVTWFLGLPDDVYGDAVNHDRFYTDRGIKAAYRAYARYVTHRRNPYTGLRYRDDPTIMTFELANEPRCRSDKSGRTLLAWADEMSRWVRKQAPRQLVAVGDEGMYGFAGNADYPYSDYEGVRSRDLLALPAVDYGTYHLYPQNWGAAAQADPVAWGRQWIADHLSPTAQRPGSRRSSRSTGSRWTPGRGSQTWPPGTPATAAGRVLWSPKAVRETSSGSSPPARTMADSTRTTTAIESSTPAAPATLLAEHAKAMASSSREATRRVVLLDRFSPGMRANLKWCCPGLDAELPEAYFTG